MDALAEIDLNLMCDEAVRDPHTYFGRLREQEPVFWNERHRAWVITRHADLSTALRSSQLTAERISPFTSAVTSAAASDEVDDTFRILEDWLVFKDPPEHTRLRKLVARAFTPTVVRARTEEISRTIRQLVAELDGEADLIREFAYPLPAVIIAQMLGVPPADRDLFKEWSDKLTSLVFGAYGREDRFETAARGMIELRDYLVDLIGQYERHPGDNLISVLLEHEDGDTLSRQELVATCTLLLFGGHETTTNLIGNGMLALLSHPDQLALLRAEPHLIGPAVDELLRYDGPARATVRMVKDPHEIGGRQLSKGDRAFLVNLSANRDPEAFEDPDRLDIERRPTNHLGFGVGIHYCLGAPLARLEGQLSISALVDSYPGLELAADPDTLDWHPTMLSRGLVHLPVRTA
ncbi:cytochrome P450 [Desertimonas flava]|uniref:cytochrome P450 n=1 Tax=Desertimonas flava TaxID=2064846 RepID=UPI000E342EB5|nr:cytochrome P450 [Desertimonas flava]